MVYYLHGDFLFARRYAASNFPRSIVFQLLRLHQFQLTKGGCMDILTQLQQLATDFLVPLLAVIVGLFVAWVVARIGAFLVRRGLERLKVDERASKSLGTNTQITKWVSGLIFWLLFIVVLWQLAIAAQSYAGVSQAAAIESPLGVLLTTWLGRIVNVGVFLLVAWLVASLLRFLVVRVLDMTRLEERLGENVPGEKSATANVNKSIGQAIFWLTFLIFMPSILGSLGLGETATSVQSLVNQLLGYIPGIIGAVIILILGALLARIVRQIVTGFLEGVGVDRLGERVGLSKEQNAQPLSALLGTVVYILIMIPVIIQALNTLGLPVISDIGTQLLGSVTSVILNILGAAVILTVAYYIAKFIADVVSSLLAGIGVNRLPAALGFKTAKGANLSEVVGYVVLVAVMLLAVQGTAQAVGLTSIAALFGSLIAFGGNVLLGIVIFLAGIYLANVASNVITSTGGEDAAFLANIARWAILIFVAGIALTQAGVTLAANVIQIILLAIGAAVALAFGLGGREAAAAQLDKWFNRETKKPAARRKTAK
ncbi:MAG: hypothetical protein C3F07_11105 [Anaerolineales bacterium]|nr:hypothetical protein [Anaerolineae bacterium]PWB72796.1 MAG: hypothetical protein C3F07_11105 [Anaerolineales bacterium]